MKIANLNTLKKNISSDAWNKLSNIMYQTVKGSDKVILTPIAKRLDETDSIISKYMSFYDSLDKSGWPEELVKLEEKQIAKIGPRSIQKPWSERREGATATFESSQSTQSCTPGKSPVKSNDLYRLRPVNNETALKKIKKNTSSGLPLMITKGEAIPIIGNSKFESWPAVLYTRTQEQGKTRDVWGISLYTIIREEPFFLPVLEWMKKQVWLSALSGPEFVNDRMDTMISYAIANGMKIVSTDFNNFDANTKGPARDCAWNDYISLFQESFHNELRDISNLFSNVGLVTPEGIFEGDHGTPSGSLNTTPIGSLAHANLLTSYGTIELDLSLILIDDCCLLLKDDKDVTAYLKHCESWGYTTNEDKTGVSDISAIFLQHLYHPELTVDGQIKGVYPISRGYNRLTHQETFDNFTKDEIKGEEFYSIRSLSILECSKYHPAFVEFVTWWLSLEKYSLLPTDDAIAKYVSRLENSDGSVGLLKNQYGDDIRGIKSWESFKLVSILEGAS